MPTCRTKGLKDELPVLPNHVAHLLDHCRISLPALCLEVAGDGVPTQEANSAVAKVTLIVQCRFA
jgi:hypothetical protein